MSVDILKKLLMQNNTDISEVRKRIQVLFYKYDLNDMNTELWIQIKTSFPQDLSICDT
eukprot:UN10501